MEAIIERQAQALAQTLECQGQKIAARLDEWFAGADYVRASHAEAVREQLHDLAGQAYPATGQLALRQLSRESRAAFSRLQDLTAEGGMERARRSVNDRYVAREAERAAGALPARWRA